MSGAEMVFTGRIWLVLDREGTPIDDIDTDQIYHNAHLAVTDIAEMGQYTFGNLEGYDHFPKEVRKEDIVLVGRNFGAGSSRQQAVDCFASLGVSCVVAWSYGAIYKRNAINSGFPILTVKELDLAALSNFDTVEIDIRTGTITKGGTTVGTVQPFSQVPMDIYKAGNIFEYGKTL